MDLSTGTESLLNGEARPRPRRLNACWSALKTCCAWLSEGIRVDCSRDPVQHVLEGDLHGHVFPSVKSSVFSTTNSEDRRFKGMDDKSVHVGLVLKLALALLAYGHNTVDAETLLYDVCRNLGLPHAHWQLGMKFILVSFNGQPAHHIVCKRGIVFDKLVATTRIANYVATATDVDVGTLKAAKALLDEVIQRPRPYGWLVQIVSYECFCMCAAVAAFSGTYWDAVAAALIGSLVFLVPKLCELSHLLGKIEGLLIPMTVGLITPIVWKHVFPVHVCRVTVWILSNVLIFLPGVQLIYGSYELESGSIHNGTSRLVAALVRVMFLVIGLTIGWQPFGHNASLEFVGGRDGAVASLPPSIPCTGEIPWWLIASVYNIPLLFFLGVILNLRLADMIGPIFFGYLSLLAYSFLLHAKDYGMLELPPLVVNFFGVFLAGNLGSFHEYMTRTPAILTILPVVLVYAPGARAVMSMLAALHNTSGDVDTSSLLQANVWGDLLLQGVSYAFGMYLAAAIWRPMVRCGHKARARDIGRDLVEFHVPVDRTWTTSLSPDTNCDFVDLDSRRDRFSSISP